MHTFLIINVNTCIRIFSTGVIYIDYRCAIVLKDGHLWQQTVFFIITMAHFLFQSEVDVSNHLITSVFEQNLWRFLIKKTNAVNF